MYRLSIPENSLFSSSCASSFSSSSFQNHVTLPYNFLFRVSDSPEKNDILYQSVFLRPEVGIFVHLFLSLTGNFSKTANPSIIDCTDFIARKPLAVLSEEMFLFS